MTVKELKELLSDIPDDATVYREGGEYQGDWDLVKKVEYTQNGAWGKPYNSIFII